MWKVPLRRTKTVAPMSTRARRQRNVSRACYALFAGVVVWTFWQEGWEAGAWFLGGLVVLLVLLFGIEMYVSWPVKPRDRS